MPIEKADETTMTTARRPLLPLDSASRYIQKAIKPTAVIHVIHVAQKTADNVWIACCAASISGSLIMRRFDESAAGFWSLV